MVVKRVLMALLVVLTMLPVATLAFTAFDGNRKGIVLGGGLGVSPVARWSQDGLGESMVGFGLQMVAGYAWNEHDMIVYENNVTMYSSEYFKSGGFWGSERLLMRQGFEGASWYHYWGSPHRAVFTVGGLGSCIFDRSENYHSDARGAYLLGAGCEVSRHFQVGLYYSGGCTDDAGREFSHRHVSVLVSGVAF